MAAHPEFLRVVDARQEVLSAEYDAGQALFSTVPTTLAGAIALLRYVPQPSLHRNAIKSLTLSHI
jgi:hypothetical protein